MKIKVLHIVLILSILSLTLLIKNHLEMSFFLNYTIELTLAKITFGIGVLVFGFYAFTKKKTDVSIKVVLSTFGICLALNLHLFSEFVKIEQSMETLSEYYELKEYSDVENRFIEDLRNGDVKFFQFGMGADFQLMEELYSDYNIESFSVGCIVLPFMEQYNGLVDEYLKDEYNSSLAAVYADLEEQYVLPTLR